MITNAIRSQWLRKQPIREVMFKVVWDKENNGVRLTLSPSGEALNVCPRPVFWEELDFLGLDKLGWEYPHSEAPLLWACERRYFYKGELVMEVRGGNLFDLPETLPLKKGISLKPVNMETLKEINEDSLFLLEHEALDFINQVFHAHQPRIDNKSNDIIYEDIAKKIQSQTKENHTVIMEDCGSFDIMPSHMADQLGKRKVYNSHIDMILVSFSGGKDSQVVLDLVSRALPADKFIVVYSDTGYELPTSLKLYEEVISHYKGINPSLKFHIAKNHQNVLYYWDEIDSPSKIHRWCCGVMKTAPLYRLLKELSGKGKQPNVLTFEGVRAEESSTRATYSRIGTGVKHNNVVNARPIFEWSVTEVWLYLLFNNLPINNAYRKGLSRVGCVICPLSSELGDCLDYHFFPNKAQPFVDKLKEKASKAKIPNIDTYLKERKWKVRAGGNRHSTKTEIIYTKSSSDLIVEVLNPREDIFEWIKTLGKTSIIYETTGKKIMCVKHGDRVSNFLFEFSQDILKLKVENILNDVIFVSLIKRVINKTAHCVHCEVCEVECPTGALTVVPYVSIDSSKCVHCARCLTFKDNGCVVANSIRMTAQSNIDMKTGLTPINRFNTFGFRKKWMLFYANNYETFFQNKDHGMNEEKQLPIFVNWLRSAKLLQQTTKEPTDLFIILKDTLTRTPSIFWEIVWINLSNNTELISLYIEMFQFGILYSRDELLAILSDKGSATKAGCDNALKALLNTFKETPLGNDIPVGIVMKTGNKTSVVRKVHNELSLVATAYSLYRYAEKTGRYSLTVSEFYNPEQKEGIVRQFGIERDAFERNLRSLEADSNHVLRSELNMGLDNIILREDLKSDDILRLLL